MARAAALPRGKGPPQRALHQPHPRLDQEVTLDDAQRAKIWRSLWQAHIAAWDPTWNIAPSVIVAGIAYHTAALEAAAALKPAKFHLDGCTAVTDEAVAALRGALPRLVIRR